MKRWCLCCGLLAACCALVACTAFARAENWPQWRGPEKNGISRETGLPAQWSETKNLAWKLALPGRGSSTPAIWGDRMFLTVAEGKELSLLCVSTEGKVLWKRGFGTANRAIIKGDETTEAAASPTTDGKHVYTFGGSGDLACFDFEGKEIWKFNAQSRYGKFSILHGVHTSPVLHEDRLYLAILHRKLHWVVAIDKATGQDVWKIDRPTEAKGESNEAYSTPAVWSDGKESYLVVVGSDHVTGHDLKDGREIWRVGDLNPKLATKKYYMDFRIITSPVATPDLIVFATANNRGDDAVIGLKPNAKGFIKAGSPFEQWRYRGSPDVPSPLVHDGFVYLCAAETGLLTCLDAKTGKPYYQKERLQTSRYRASPVYADGKIYLTARDGTVHVVKPGPKFEILAQNRLPDVFTASPAISNGRIFFRGWENLYAIQEGGKGK